MNKDSVMLVVYFCVGVLLGAFLAATRPDCYTPVIPYQEVPMYQQPKDTPV